MDLAVLRVFIMYWAYSRDMMMCKGMGVWRVMGIGLSWDDEGCRWGGDLRLCCLTWPRGGGARWLWSGWRSLTLGLGCWVMFGNRG